MKTDVVESPKVLRVLCIDDSSSILTLMKKILVKEKGFEVVGTAENGEVGAKKVNELKPDLVTLDLHMPVCSGIEYLAKFQKENSPPVVVVSSVNREDTELAQKALKLGASDYVEKPALNNLKERSEELYAKLRTAYKSRGKTKELELDSTFAKSKNDVTVENCISVLICKNVDLAKLEQVLKDRPNCPSFIAVDGSPKEVFDQLKAKAYPVQAAPSQPTGNGLAIGDVTSVQKATQNFKGKVCVMVFGSPKGYPELLKYPQMQVLVEDLGNGNGQEPYASIARDILPITSFAFLALQFFSNSERKVA